MISISNRNGVITVQDTIQYAAAPIKVVQVYRSVGVHNAKRLFAAYVRRKLNEPNYTL